MGLPVFLAAVGTVASLSAANRQKKAAEEAARVAKEVGELQARQYIAELFLGKAQALSKADRRLEEMQLAENQNIAAFSAMGRDDRSVDAYLKKNRQLAGKDVAAITRASELEVAKRVTEAAVAKKYGENKAAGLRAQGNANYMSNISNVLTSAPLQTLVNAIPKTPTK